MEYINLKGGDVIGVVVFLVLVVAVCWSCIVSIWEQTHPKR